LTDEESQENGDAANAGNLLMVDFLNADHLIIGVTAMKVVSPHNRKSYHETY
jgi:hypothetical protein